MEQSKKRIEQSFNLRFGKNGSHKKWIQITANNYREPIIDMSSSSERLTVDNIRDIAKFMNEVADNIDNDSELFPD